MHAARTLSTVKRLHEALLADYDRTVRPIGDQDDALRVEFAVSLVQVADLDGDSGTLTIITWLHMVSRSFSRLHIRCAAHMFNQICEGQHVL